MNRKHLYLAPAIGRNGPARLRLLKEDTPGGQTGAAPVGTQANGQNNPQAVGVNSGDSGNGPQSQNNTGAQFDGNSFWGSSDQNQGSGSSQDGQSAGSQGNGSDTGAQNLSQTLTTQLQAMRFGDPIFTDDVAKEINEGNFNGVQQRFDAMGQNIVRQSLNMMVQIMRPLSEQIMSQVRDEFKSTLTNRDNNDALTKDFPAARDPRVAPVIQQVFDQALRNSGGDRSKAVSQTKEMLALMSNITAGDLNLNIAPRGPDDSGRPAQPINWLDELTVR